MVSASNTLRVGIRGCPPRTIIALGDVLPATTRFRVRLRGDQVGPKALGLYVGEQMTALDIPFGISDDLFKTAVDVTISIDRDQSATIVLNQIATQNKSVEAIPDIFNIPASHFIENSDSPWALSYAHNLVALVSYLKVHYGDLLLSEMFCCLDTMAQPLIDALQSNSDDIPQSAITEFLVNPVVRAFLQLDESLNMPLWPHRKDQNMRAVLQALCDHCPNFKTYEQHLNTRVRAFSDEIENEIEFNLPARARAPHFREPRPLSEHVLKLAQENGLLGIDIGSFNMTLALLSEGRPYLFPLGGRRTTPAMCSFHDGDGKPSWESDAIGQVLNPPETAFWDLLHWVGCEAKAQPPFSYLTHPNGKLYFRVDQSRIMEPDQVVAQFLQFVRFAVEMVVGKSKLKTVLTIPVSYSTGQQELLKKAATNIGLEVVALVPKPIATVAAYGLHLNPRSQKIIVYDWGANNFSVSLVEAGGGICRVLDSRTQPDIGGIQITRAIVELATNQLLISKDDKCLRGLYADSENMKLIMSTTLCESVSTHVKRDLRFDSFELNRQQFATILTPFLRNTEALCQEMLQAAGIVPDDIHKVLLVGGNTHIPAVHESVKANFGDKVVLGLDPQEAVALGSVIVGGQMTDSLDVLPRKVPLTIGFSFGDKAYPMIRRGASIPKLQSQAVVFIGLEDSCVDRMRIYSGEHPLFKDNKVLGALDLRIPESRKVRREIIFCIDTAGCLSVIAKNKETGDEDCLYIDGATDVGWTEISESLNEAIVHVDQDLQIQRNCEVIQNARHLLLLAEGVPKPLLKNLPTALVSTFRQGLANLTRGVRREDLALIQEAIYTLSTIEFFNCWKAVMLEKTRAKPDPSKLLLAKQELWRSWASLRLEMHVIPEPLDLLDDSIDASILGQLRNDESDAA